MRCIWTKSGSAARRGAKSASRPAAPDVVHAHALYQAARLRQGPAAVVMNFPGEPNPRYAADIAMADGLIADGWAAAELPGKLGHPVHAVPKGVDAERFRPAGPNLRRELGVEGKRVVLERRTLRADQEHRAADRGDGAGRAA